MGSRKLPHNSPLQVVTVAAYPFETSLLLGRRLSAVTLRHGRVPLDAANPPGRGADSVLRRRSALHVGRRRNDSEAAIASATVGADAHGVRVSPEGGRRRQREPLRRGGPWPCRRLAREMRHLRATARWWGVIGANLRRWTHTHTQTPSATSARRMRRTSAYRTPPRGVELCAHPDCAGTAT